MNDNAQCMDCGFGFPKYHIKNGLCYTCQPNDEIHFLGFSDDDYGKSLCGLDCYNSTIENDNLRLKGEKGVTCKECLQLHNKEIATDKAFRFVSRCFQQMGGSLDNNDIVYKNTSKWNDAKLISKWFISNITTSEFSNFDLEQIDFWRCVQEEINNL